MAKVFVQLIDVGMADEVGGRLDALIETSCEPVTVGVHFEEQFQSPGVEGLHSNMSGRVAVTREPLFEFADRRP